MGAGGSTQRREGRGSPPGPPQHIINVRQPPPPPPHPSIQQAPPPPPQPVSGGPPSAPEPTRLELQKTCVVKNPVNLLKKTLQITKMSGSAHLYELSFNFDAASPAEIEVYFASTERLGPEQSPIFEGGKQCNSVVSVPAGMNQTYKSKECLNLLDYPLGDLQYSPGSSLYPIVVVLRCRRSTVGPDSIEGQYTYASLLNKAKHFLQSDKNEGHDSSDPSEEKAWGVQTIKQKIQYGKKFFEVQEIYGIDRSNTGDAPLPEDDMMAGRECVICLAEERNTAVLPCRHMCLCSGCADIMRRQSNKCPICRQTVNSLLQISVNI
eukprot:GHVS01098220.1.p1 GENE.GHVS01098220.1~~GHVS01098220.1.p1  ORF type:complete len:330 (+),score=49.69 GHVS01098220.1:27-992(+)